MAEGSPPELLTQFLDALEDGKANRSTFAIEREDEDAGAIGLDVSDRHEPIAWRAEHGHPRGRGDAYHNEHGTH